MKDRKAILVLDMSVYLVMKLQKCEKQVYISEEVYVKYELLLLTDTNQRTLGKVLSRK